MVKKSRLHIRSRELNDSLDRANTTFILRVIHSCTTLDQINYALNWIRNLSEGFGRDPKFQALPVVALNYRVQLINKLQAGK